ncbi:putative cytosine deaminase [Venturia nashicola]|uniref:Cytosine deaminase n=1 Tax=Venturia nashicola TaxID=86259 RepID=A0A4Z1NM07_9PEZI|nr:putative cytosine deaminase [Venturia nashicola]
MRESNSPGFKAAMEEAEAGAKEGGVPIGAALVAADGTILGRGHNMRIQKSSPTIHQQAETSAFENAGRLPASAYKGATVYTSLSPCIYCTGLCLLYGVKRVVIGENKTFVGGEDLLEKNGVKVVVLDNARGKELMAKFIKENPGEWNEDIGKE